MNDSPPSTVPLFRSAAGVEEALGRFLLPADPALDSIERASVAAGLPAIAVAKPLGRLLSVLGLALGAKRVLEIGTLGGSGAVWLARGLAPGGRIVSLELDAGRADLARRSLADTGLGDSVEVVTGAALDWLDAAIARGEPPFDLVFIDADKERSRDYVQRALTLSRPGTVIVVDNVVREGRVADVDCPDAGVQGIRRMLEWIAARPDLAATALQTIDAKGHDGFLLAVVRGGDGGTRID